MSDLNFANFLGAQYYNEKNFGAENRSIFLDNVVCLGSEDNLLQCNHSTIGSNNCSHSNAVSVHCFKISTVLVDCISCYICLLKIMHSAILNLIINYGLQ